MKGLHALLADLELLLGHHECQHGLAGLHLIVHDHEDTVVVYEWDGCVMKRRPDAQGIELYIPELDPLPLY